MIKFPREELSYKRFYKNLDLNRKLEIEWPKNNLQNNTKIIIKDEESKTSSLFHFDELDLNFYDSNLKGKIDKPEFYKYLSKINKNFNEHQLSKIDEIKIYQISNKYCDVCGYSDPEENNEILTCQGCGISTHENCYGVLSDSLFLCTKCVYHFEDGNCKFCKDKNGLLKRTVEGEWIHVACALLHPGISFKNEELREPVETYEFLDNNIDDNNNDNNIDDNNNVNKDNNVNINNNNVNNNKTPKIKCSFKSCPLYFDCSFAISELYCDINNRRVYCKNHDPTNERNILSRNNYMDSLYEYSLLKNEIFERESIPYQKRIETEYSKVTKMEPIIISEGYFGLLNQSEMKSIKEQIENYWIEKRKAYGTYFEDMFMLPNRLLNKLI